MHFRVYSAFILGLSAFSAALPHSLNDRGLAVGNVFTRPNAATKEGYEITDAGTEKRGLAVGNVFTRPNAATEEDYESTDAGIEKRGITVGNVFARPGAAAEEQYETPEGDAIPA